MDQIVKVSTEVYCTLQIEGTHNWPSCPFEEVDYLRVPHRHVFHIKAHYPVTHSDRDVEFIMLKHKLDTYIKGRYFDVKQRLCVFGAMSCEMIAEELMQHFLLSRCEVSEDGENGAIITREEIVR